MGFGYAFPKKESTVLGTAQLLQGMSKSCGNIGCSALVVFRGLELKAL